MQQSCYKKEGFLQYLVLSNIHLYAEDYQNILMQCVEIPHLLPYEIREINGEQNIYYRLSYKTTLKSVEGHLPFTKERLENMVQSIVRVLLEMEEYLLESEYIIWDSEFIFIEADTGKLQFCYAPDRDFKKEKLTDLLTELIQYVDKKKEEEIIFILQFYNLMTEPDFSAEQLRNYIKTEDREVYGEYVERIDYPKENKYCEEYDKETINKSDTKTEKEFIDKFDVQTDKKANKKSDKRHDKAKSSFEILISLLLIGTAVVNIILILCLVFEVLTYNYIKYLLFGMGALIILTIIYMQSAKEENADDIMKEYFENSMSNIKENQININEKQKEINVNLLNRNIENIFENEESEKKEKDISKKYIGETTILSQTEEKYEEKVVVEKVENQLYLEAMIKDRFPAITFQEESIILGCMKDSCNYLLEERGISRMHAKLMKQADGIYLLDLNSTNGTYLNGEAIDSGKDYKLEEGDLVAFAQCEFYVAGKAPQ